MMMIVVMQNHAKQKLDITSIGKQLMEDNNELCQSQKTKLIQCKLVSIKYKNVTIRHLLILVFTCEKL